MDKFLAPGPPPATKLGEYRALSSRAGVHVSPLCLGAMSIGESNDVWTGVMGSAMTKEKSFELLDAYFDMGGNFIDTANGYQDETSEQIIGAWIEARKNRDQVVLATKYTTHYKVRDPAIKNKVNYVGNNVKSMRLSVEASLEKLRTSYIDLLYVHWWDYETSVEEVMDGLHNLVVAGKVLYLGISDAPAWVVAQANTYAKAYGKTPFVVYQGQWNIMARSFERDIIPMARSFGIALAPWGVIGGGRLRTDAEEKRRLESGDKGRGGDAWQRTQAEITVSHALEKVAGELGVKSITSGELTQTLIVAIAYVMQKTTHVFPIIGGHKVEHLKDNLEALDITLSAQQIEYLESVSEFDPGFPNTIIGDGTYISPIMRPGATIVKHPLPKPITASTAPSR
ncbi:Aldo/keto reductase [Cylindrobasidium torrendii FP15055 ss-10]|uniref:Aldo/keto reductase n=1 Tax=Cylindrobasidium torrendii FP15055 ss-10 TaxID=1314674 RepID=A0A0D7BAV6_9AGAR|nr:Aldo/keto reductase [Cylindrobasidium torrendii FP15055 ss-10]